MKDDELRQVYEELGEERDIPARAAAVSDFLKPPSIEGLDLEEYASQVGNEIYFMASDNVGVVNAQVKITDPQGTLFENGMAVEVQADTGYWMYTATRAIPSGTPVVISVLVSDRPRHVAEVTEEKVL